MKTIKKNNVFFNIVEIESESIRKWTKILFFKEHTLEKEITPICLGTIEYGKK